MYFFVLLFFNLYQGSGCWYCMVVRTLATQVLSGSTSRAVYFKQQILQILKKWKKKNKTKTTKNVFFLPGKTFKI